MNGISKAEQYRLGYQEAARVFGIAHHPGFCKSDWEARRCAEIMWARGLSEAEALSQRAEILQDLRQRNDSLVPRPGPSAGSSSIVKPSSQREMEPDSTIWDRWKQQMSVPGAEPVGQVLKTEVR